MATKLIRMDDDTLVEAEVSEDEAREIAGGLADKVESSFDAIGPVLKNICRPITTAWQELDSAVDIEKAEIQLGLSFEGQGNLFVTRAKAGANLVIKLILKPKERQE